MSQRRGLGRRTRALSDAHTDHTLEDLRECIAVPSMIERMLRGYTAMLSAEARCFEKVLMLRRQS
jgi:hypothetical protein